MAFRFGLEPVLKHRKRLEEIAQREFAEAQAAVEAALKQIEDMYARLDQVRVEISQAEKSGRLAEVREMEGFIQGHKVRIETVRQEALITAAQEKKVLVKLKEKRLNEYKEWIKKIEAKNMDDQTMMRQAWGKR